MTDSTIPPLTNNTSPVKPGWQTTEFWLATAAKVLGVLFASGVLGTGTVAERIAGIAAALLAQLGYTVSRSIVKVASVALFVVFLASAGASTTACTGIKSASSAIIDCTKANQASIEALILEFRSLLQGNAPDWSAVEARAIAAGETIGGCALAELVTGEAKPAGLRSADQGRATLEDFRARAAGGATFRTARGDL